MSAHLETERLYLDPAVFRKIAGDDLLRAANRLLPTVAKTLNIASGPQLEQLRLVLMRDVLPDTIQEIMNLANEKINGEPSE